MDSPKNLTYWLKTAEHAQREDGATPEQLEAFARRTDAELDDERKSGRMATFTGKLPKRRAG